MSRPPKLTLGWVHAFFNNLRLSRDISMPIVQIYDIKLLEKTKKYSCWVSDGVTRAKACFSNEDFNSIKLDINMVTPFIKLILFERVTSNSTTFLRIRNAQFLTSDFMTLTYGEPVVWDTVDREIEYETLRSKMVHRLAAEETERTRRLDAAAQQRRLLRLEGEELDANVMTFIDNNATAPASAPPEMTVRITPFKDMRVGNFPATYQGRVEKSEIISGNKNGRSWQLLKATLVDAAGDRVQVATFSPNTFVDALQPGTCVTLCNVVVKRADPAWNPPGHVPFSMDLAKHTIVSPTANMVIPMRLSKMFPFEQLKMDPELQKDSIFGVLGYIVHLGDLVMIGKTEKKFPKMDVILLDSMSTYIQISLLGDQNCSQAMDAPLGDLVAFENCTIGEYSDKRSFTCAFKSMFHVASVHPQLLETEEAKHFIAEYHRLVGENVNPVDVFNADREANPNLIADLSGRSGGGSNLTLPQLREKAVDATMGYMSDLTTFTGKDPKIYRVRAALTRCVSGQRSSEYEFQMPWYLACPTCRKKVACDLDADGNKQYYCVKCNVVLQQCERRFVWSVTLADSTGSAYVTLFDNVATVLLGTSADGLIVNADNDLEEQALVTLAQSQVHMDEYIFYMSRAVDTYQDKERVKITVQGVEPVNFVAESTSLIEKIHAMAPELQARNPEYDEDAFQN